MLPARLSPIEEYFLLDDCQAYPMTVLVRIRFAGRLKRQPFESAVRDVVQLHPLLRARVEVTGESKRWVACDDWTPNVLWDVPCDAGAWPNAGYINICEEPGTRFHVIRRDEYDDVIVQVHHCCADAMGLCRLTEDLLAAYSGHASERSDSVQPPRNISAKRFSKRGMPGMPRWRFTLMVHRWRVRWNHCMKIVKTTCSQLVPDNHPRVQTVATPDDAQSDYPSIKVVRFDREQTGKIIRAAKTQGVTVNSILIRDLFLSIQQWRSELGVSDEDDTLRLCVPVDLRTARDAEMPVTNVLSLLFLDRKPPELLSEPKLLEGIQQELHGRNRNDFRISFVTLLEVGRRLPGGLKRFLSNRRCWATCIFSSLGVLFRNTSLPTEDLCLVADNVRMEQWDLIPPLRGAQGLTICPYTYAGRMSILFHYDPRRINSDQLAQMLQGYSTRLERSSGIQSGELNPGEPAA